MDCVIVHEITLSFLLACYFGTKVNQSKEWSNGEDDHLPKFCLIWKYGNVKRLGTLPFIFLAQPSLSSSSLGSLSALSMLSLEV